MLAEHVKPRREEAGGSNPGEAIAQNGTDMKGKGGMTPFFDLATKTMPP